MKPIACPICAQKSPPGSHRCLTCGADFSDPDVMALSPEDLAAISQSSLGEAGALAELRFLGVAHESLVAGVALRKLALLGGLVLLAAFLLPVASADYRTWLLPWQALDGGPTFALLFSGLAAVVAVTLFAVRAVPGWIRAAALTGLGLIGLLFTIAPLGQYAAGAEKTPYILWLGLLVAGAGVALRLYHPQSREARYILIGGAVVGLAGMLLPMSGILDALIGEFSIRFRPEALGDTSLAGAYYAGVRHDAMVQLVSLYGLLPLALLPAAVALAWPQPGGVWDKTSTPLRAVGWAIALYLPAAFALYMFNITGWDFEWVRYKGTYAPFDDFSAKVTTGRAQLGLMAACYAIWVQFGAVALYEHFRPKAAQ